MDFGQRGICKTTDFAASQDLHHRFRFYPREIWPEDGHFILSSDKDKLQEEIRRSRKDEKAWPRIHYLWELNPIVEWTTPAIPLEFGHVLYQLDSERIQVNVSHKLLKIRILVTYYRFVAVLEKMTVAMMTAVICDCIASKKPAHKLRQTTQPTPQKNMGVVGHQCPSIDNSVCLRGNLSHPRNEIVSICSVINDFALFYSPDNDMM